MGDGCLPRSLLGAWFAGGSGTLNYGSARDFPIVAGRVGLPLRADARVVDVAGKGVAMRKREILWNAETMAGALDVPRSRLIRLLRLQLVPKPVILKGECLWRAKDVREWAQRLGVADPAETASYLLARWQDEERGLLEREGHA